MSFWFLHRPNEGSSGAIQGWESLDVLFGHLDWGPSGNSRSYIHGFSRFWTFTMCCSACRCWSCAFNKRPRNRADLTTMLGNAVLGASATSDGLPGRVPLTSWCFKSMVWRQCHIHPAGTVSQMNCHVFQTGSDPSDAYGLNVHFKLE